MNKWIIIALIVIAFVVDVDSQECDMEGDDEDDECCSLNKVKKQVTQTKQPDLSQLPNLPPLTEQDLPKNVSFIGPFLTVPGILHSNQGIRGPLGNQSDVLMAIMQPNCDLMIYNFKIGIDNALWHSSTNQKGVNCTLHVNKDWTMDIRTGNGLKIWTAGLQKAYLDKAIRMHVIPTKDDGDLNIRLVLLNEDTTKNLIIQ